MKRMEERGVLNDGTPIDYAWGLVHGSFRGARTLGHGGADAGFRSWVGRFPDHDLGIAVLSNHAEFDAGGKAMEIAAIVLGDALGPDPEGASDSRQLSGAMIDRLIGAFSLESGDVFEVRRSGSQIVAAQGSEVEATVLRPTGDLEFDWGSRSVRFIPGDNGDSAVAGRVEIRWPEDDGGESRLLVGTRIAPMTLDDLARLIGRYWSPELLTFYDLEWEGQSLVARHQRHDDIPLTVRAPGLLEGNTWWFGKAQFEEADGEVRGFRLTGGRVRNLWFERLR